MLLTITAKPFGQMLVVASSLCFALILSRANSLARLKSKLNLIGCGARLIGAINNVAMKFCRPGARACKCRRLKDSNGLRPNTPPGKTFTIPLLAFERLKRSGNRSWLDARMQPLLAHQTSPKMVLLSLPCLALSKVRCTSLICFACLVLIFGLLLTKLRLTPLVVLMVGVGVSCLPCPPVSGISWLRFCMAWLLLALGILVCARL